ncbi:MAG: CoA pyrophosphatase [Smithella sp.]|jgi:8-oxo-dGTP pyrophosphatase MutT (NUDIX family)
MDLTLFQKKHVFSRFVMDKLATVPIDYIEKNIQIDKSRQEGSAHLKAAVVLLLNFKKINGQSEYVFQLIKRSQRISQGGDISCPGGMLQPKQDNFLSSFLKTGMLPALRGRMARRIQRVDSGTATFIRLFLTNALREAWEEIGLNPLNTKFLGALPSYSLTLFARTIFPVVCITRKPFTYKLSSEVEKILEIPLSFFFHNENYATLDVKASLGEKSEPLQYQTPCFVIPDGRENNEILWGATFNIIHNFLRIISDDSVPTDYSSRTLSKVLTLKYISPRS